MYILQKIYHLHNIDCLIESLLFKTVFHIFGKILLLFFFLVIMLMLSIFSIGKFHQLYSGVFIIDFKIIVIN